MRGAMPMRGVAWHGAADADRSEAAWPWCVARDQRGMHAWTSSCEVRELVDRRGAENLRCRVLLHLLMDDGRGINKFQKLKLREMNRHSAENRDFIFQISSISV